MELVTNLLHIVLYEAVGFFYRLWESPVISLILFGAGVALGYRLGH